jgi:hypothetical protein
MMTKTTTVAGEVYRRRRCLRGTAAPRRKASAKTTGLVQFGQVDLGDAAEGRPHHGVHRHGCDHLLDQQRQRQIADTPGGNLSRQLLAQAGEHAWSDVLNEGLHGRPGRTCQRLGDHRRRHPRFAAERLGQRPIDPVHRFGEIGLRAPEIASSRPRIWP